MDGPYTKISLTLLTQATNLTEQMIFVYISIKYLQSFSSIWIFLTLSWHNNFNLGLELTTKLWSLIDDMSSLVTHCVQTNRKSSHNWCSKSHSITKIQFDSQYLKILLYSYIEWGANETGCYQFFSRKFWLTLLYGFTSQESSSIFKVCFVL